MQEFSVQHNVNWACIWLRNYDWLASALLWLQWSGVLMNVFQLFMADADAASKSNTLLLIHVTIFCIREDTWKDAKFAYTLIINSDLQFLLLHGTGTQCANNRILSFYTHYILIFVVELFLHACKITQSDDLLLMAYTKKNFDNKMM